MTSTTSTPISIAPIVRDVAGIRGVVVTMMPDCLLLDSWLHPEETFPADEVGAYFGDLIRANREGLRALSSLSQEMQVTIEAGDRLVVLRELPGNFVVGFVLKSDMALGMVRLHVKRVLERMVTMLPVFAPTERPKAVRVLEYLHRYAPDAHAANLRVSLRTGLPLDALNHPETMSEAQTELVANAVRDVLGLEELHV